MNSITVTISPERIRTRLQVTLSGQPILRAILGPAQEADLRAAATLIEGLALWLGQPLSVVLYVVSGDTSSGARELCEGLEVGRKQALFDVGLVFHRNAIRRRRCNVGEFRDLTRVMRSITR